MTIGNALTPMAGVPLLELRQSWPAGVCGVSAPCFTGSKDVVLAFRAFGWAESAREHVAAFYLDPKGYPVGYSLISVGTVSSSLVHPREVFAPALFACASAVVVAHNHPTGDPTPSPEDCAITRRLAEAGRILGVEVLDHVVIGNGPPDAVGAFFSFHVAGRLKDR